jgi:anti-anti-sigma factor
MELKQREENGVVIVSLTGRLDAASAPDAETELEKLSTENARLLINLRELEYISSAGLRVLLVTAKTVRRKGGRLCLCAMIESVNEVFEISGFSSIFDIAETEEDAKSILSD